MAWFSNQWNRWTDNDTQSKEVRRVEVAWGRERLQVVLPSDIQPARIGDLRTQVSAITSIPSAAMKLVFNGLVLRDDRSTLASYGIREGGRVLLLGTAGGASASEDGKAGGAGERKLTPGEEAARAKRRKENDTSEQGLLAKIAEVRDHTRADLLSELELLEASVRILSSTTASTSSQQQANSAITTIGRASVADVDTPSGDPRSAKYQPPLFTSISEMHAAHRRLSEFLLRALLSLDSVPVNGEVTRQARKLVVKEVQSYLDRTDAAWASAKERDEVKR